MARYQDPWSQTKHFLINTSFTIGIIVFLFWGTGFIIYNDLNNEYGEESLRYKEIVFLSSAGKHLEVTDVRSVDISKGLEWASRVGTFIKTQHDKSVSLNDILKQYRDIFKRSQAFSDGDSHQREKFLVTLGSRGIPAEILSMARDWRWQEMADNSEDMKTLDLILSGKKQPPVLVYKYLPYPWQTFWLGWLIATQFFSYLIFIIRMDNERIRISEELCWNKFRTYAIFVLFSPGALPLLLINPGMVSFFNWMGKKQSERKTANREAGYRLNRLVPEINSFSSQELLDKLKRRVGGV